MTNKPPPHVRKRDPDAVDPRVVRTQLALGRALIALIQERDFAEITVQAILDRADVGRTAFYAHFRNKEDVLQSSYEHLFGVFDRLLERQAGGTPRLFPVAEFLEHVGESAGVLHALRRSGQLDDLWLQSVGYIARIIELRLDRAALAGAARNAAVTNVAARSLLARMLAGALVESIRWWEDRRGTATPEEMDAAFHAFARGVLAR